VVILDRDGRILELNAAAAAMGGVSAADVLEKPIWELITPRRMGVLLERSFREWMTHSQRPLSFEIRWRSADGRLRTAVWRVSPPDASSGRLLCHALELTGCHRLPSDRRNAERRFRALWQQSMDGMRLCDAKHRTVLVNEAFCRLTGRTPEQLIRRPVWEVCPAEDHQAIADLHDRLFANPETRVSGRYRLVRPDGSVVPVDASCSVVRFPEGEPLLLTIVRDVSAQIQQAAELERARIQAEEASAAKTEFLANMSHEIRTPLHAVLGFAEVLLDSDLREDQREQAKRLRAAAEMLRNLVNDLLDFSKAEAQRMTLENVEFELRPTVESAFETLSPRAHEKALRYTLEMDPALPGWLVGDPHRFRQILLNLIGNAVKFTESGFVAVRVQDRGQADGAVRVRVEIEDSGIGIDPEKQSLIFEPFRQADGSTTRRFGGTGLGLTISSRLVEMMGGRLECESEPGRGSRFWFEVALPVVAGKPVPRRRLSVLVVDDHPTNREVLLRLLERAGHDIQVASTGRESVEMWRSTRFDLILMDIQMPELDGFEATQEIRRQEALAGRATAPVAIVAMTANVTEEDRRRCLAAGMNWFLGKPVEWKELEKVLERASVHAHVAPPPVAADLDLALSRVGGDRDLLREVAQLFLESYPQDLVAIREAVHSGNAKALERAAHTLKGAVANFGALEAGRLALELERAGRAGDLAAASRLFELLEQAMQRLEPVLRQL
jgi:PAS domain S-box-containing protein